MSAISEKQSRDIALALSQSVLAGLNAKKRVSWALENLPGPAVLSSSFGAQAAVCLHLVTEIDKSVPVIFVDTGYHFPETYQFVDELTERLNLNLHVYRASNTPAWQEARSGRRWEQGVDGLDAYNQENKVEPMQRALDDLSAGTWFAGLRRSQSVTRSDAPFIQSSGSRWKIHPIADWSDKDIYDYLNKHALPYHPLWYKGYVSIGDTHTTRSLAEVNSLEETRFFGLKRECGLHEMDFGGRENRAAC